MAIEPPTDRVDRVSVMPLAQKDADRARAPFGAEEGYQFLSYRTGTGPGDGFFFLDGHNGGGRNPHHVSALKYLRQGGRRLLEGYGNMVTVLRDGMAENSVARAARLDATVALDGLAWVRSTVPNDSWSSWQRDILWVDERFTIVADTVTAREAGQFEIACRWAPMGQVHAAPEGMRGVQQNSDRPATVLCATPATTSVEAGHFVEKRNLTLDAGAAAAFINIVYGTRARDTYPYTIRPVAENIAVLGGEIEALVIVGEATTRAAALSVDAEVSMLSAERVSMMQAHSLAGDAQLISASAPVSLSWRLTEGTLMAECAEDVTLALALAPDAAPTADGEAVAIVAADGLVSLQLAAGRHKLEGVSPSADVAATVARAIDSAPTATGDDADGEDGVAEPEALAEVWRTDAGGPVDLLAAAPAAGAATDVVWAATSEEPGLAIIGPDGQMVRRIALPARANALVLVPATTGDQGMLAGGEDDLLRRYTPDGESLWEATSTVSTDYEVGDRYQAPWFTDPERKWGIRSLLVADVTGTGQSEIVAGRPSTVEYWSLAGELIKRVAVEWGDASDLALLSTDDGPRVLVGKSFTGHAAISFLNAKREVQGHGYNAIAQDATHMGAWMQQSVTPVFTHDMNGDGQEDVVAARTGHWNEVRVADGATAACLWQRSFGPGPQRVGIVRTVTAADLAEVEGVEVAVGLANGWLCCFDREGQPLYSRLLPAGVTAAVVAGGRLVVGLSDGQVLVMSEAGEVLRAAELGSAVTALVVTEELWQGGRPGSGRGNVGGAGGGAGAVKVAPPEARTSHNIGTLVRDQIK